MITGLEEAAAIEGVEVTHAGTALNDGGEVVTAGGRVLNVTGLGPSPADARRRAYDAAEKISFDGMQMRTDIAARAVERAPPADLNRRQMETEPQSTGSATPAPTPPPPDTMPEVEEAFEEIEVDAPLVGIIMGSKNDKPKMQPAGKVLHEHGISYEVRVLSAHRQPEETADYCDNARMRGLKVIIAGAGMSAALPGFAASKSDLPVIGVPILGKILGGLDALLSAVQMPPGVPVACVAIDGAKNAGLLAVRIINAVIPRYTRDEIGAVWTQQRKLETWLEVELAVTDAWATRGSSRPRTPRRAARRPRSRSRRSTSASGRPTTTSPPSSTSSRSRSASTGRWIHYGLTSSDVLDTALALQLREAGEIVVEGARAYRDALIAKAREHADDALRRAHPRRPRRADDLRPAAGGLRLRGGPQPGPARRRLRAGRGRQALGRGRHLRLAAARRSRSG